MNYRPTSTYGDGGTPQMYVHEIRDLGKAPMSEGTHWVKMDSTIRRLKRLLARNNEAALSEADARVAREMLEVFEDAVRKAHGG